MRQTYKVRIGKTTSCIEEETRVRVNRPPCQNTKQKPWDFQSHKYKPSFYLPYRILTLALTYSFTLTHTLIITLTLTPSFPYPHPYPLIRVK